MDDHETPHGLTDDWEDHRHGYGIGEYHIQLDTGLIAAAEQTLEQANRTYGTGFTLAHVRRPALQESGRWNCRFQLPTIVTRYGETAHDHRLPTRRLFDVRYMRALLIHNRWDWRFRLGLEPQGDVLRLDTAQPIEQVVWALSLDDLLQANLIVEDEDEHVMPGLHMLVERQSRTAIPAAEGCILKLKVEHAPASGWTASHTHTLNVSVESSLYRYRKPEDSVYDHYTDTPCSVSDAEVLRRLHDDSALLRREVMMRYDERYRIVRDAVTALRADNRSDADDGRELRVED